MYLTYVKDTIDVVFGVTPDVPTGAYVISASIEAPEPPFGTAMLRPWSHATPETTGAETEPTLTLVTGFVAVPETVNLSSVIVEDPPVDTKLYEACEASVAPVPAAM